MFGNVSRSRLLPMSLPFRYFGAAVAFQAAAWALLLVSWKEFPSFEAGLGPVFGALHLLTLGVLAMTAIGATLQLLPVATRQPVRALRAVKLVWWLLVPGTLVFCAGAALYRPGLMGAGAMGVLFALGIYSFLLMRNLAGARGMKLVVAHGWAALACLVALAATGLAVVGRYEHGWALDHAALRNAHLVLATFGFMGLLSFGLSTFLLPMLAVAPPPAASTTKWVLVVASVAILIGSLGFVLAAALLGLAAAIAHVVAMERALRARLRQPLGASFLLVRVSWGCLIASLALAALMALGLAPPRAPLLFGLLLVPGWLLTFLLGVLQRIVPFLASVHASSSTSGTPLISALTPARLLASHRVLHLLALSLLIASAMTGAPWLSLAGAAAGLAGALAFAAFFAFVLMKVHHGIQPPHQPATA
jgi:hypothetical protein